MERTNQISPCQANTETSENAARRIAVSSAEGM